ncbi:MAG: RNA polymerase sigma factor [Ruminiclostridium sp.]|nr:RNA polymerase sigma factor [Ruminiclostridium sp.]
MDNYADRYRSFLDGNDDELTVIVEKYQYGLTLYINGIVKDICVAEEIMQETFIKLAVKRPKFSGRSSFATWLFSIARNCTFDYIRKRARHKEVPIDECFTISDETDIETQYLKEEQKIELHAAMKRLKSDYSQVLYLMYFEGFDTGEIADIMHKTRRQITDLIYHAKKSLKTELERSGFKYEEF